MKMNAEKWVSIGRPADVPVEGSRRLTVANEQIAVFKNRDGEIYALQDSCPHAGGPLSEGIVHGDCVTCPLHNWVISLTDGEAQGADEGHVKTYPIKVVDNSILLKLPEDVIPDVRSSDSAKSANATEIKQALNDLRTA